MFLKYDTFLHMHSNQPLFSRIQLTNTSTPVQPREEIFILQIHEFMLQQDRYILALPIKYSRKTNAGCIFQQVM